MSVEHGLRPARFRPCPRVAARLRCLAGGIVRSRLDGCACEAAHALGLYDHPTTWRADDGSLVLALEPYSAPGAAVAELAARLADLPLVVETSDRSPWCPGSTTLVLVRGVRP